MKRIVIGLIIFASSIAFAGEKIVLGGHEAPPIESSQLPGFGMVPEIVSAAFKETGYDVEYKFFPMARNILMIINGDILGGMVAKDGFSEDSKSNILIPKTLTYSHVVFFYKKSKYPNGIDFNSMDDLKKLSKYKVGLINGAPQTKLFEDNKIKVESVTTDDQNFKKLKLDRIDLVSTVDVIGLQAIKQIGDKDSDYGMTSPMVRIEGTVIFSKQFPNSEKIMQDLVKGYEIAKKNGTLKKILEKYYGTGSVPDYVLGEK